MVKLHLSRKFKQGEVYTVFVARMGVCWSYLVEGAGLVGAVYLERFRLLGWNLGKLYQRERVSHVAALLGYSLACFTSLPTLISHHSEPTPLIGQI